MFSSGGKRILIVHVQQARTNECLGRFADPFIAHYNKTRNVVNNQLAIYCFLMGRYPICCQAGPDKLREESLRLVYHFVSN